MNKKGVIFNKTILNILHNIISHETITADDKEAPCFNSTTKTLMQEINEIFKKFSQKYQKHTNLRKTTFAKQTKSNN